MAQTKLRQEQETITTTPVSIYYLSGAKYSSYTDPDTSAAASNLTPNIRDSGPVSYNLTGIGAGETKEVPFITPEGFPGTNILPNGIYRVYLTARQTAGTREVQMFAKIYKITSAGTRTLLVTTTKTPVLTAVSTTYELLAYGGPFTLNITDRIVVDVFAYGGASGTNGTVSLPTASATNTERLELPLNNTNTLGTSLSGWIFSSYVWTRTGDLTFTVPGDVTAIFRKGTKVRYKDGGSYEYGVVESSAYTSLTTVTLISNSTYAMASNPTDTYISYIENPEGFPDWFSYTTTASRSGGSYTNNPTINIAKWKAIGQQIFVVVRATMNATPGSSGYQTFTLPASPAASGVSVGMNVSDTYAMSAIFDAGSGQLRAWKYDGTTEATGSKIYHYSGSYQY